MEAVIFCGLQASGKSSFYKAHFFNTHLRINLDMLRTRYREKLLLSACLEMKQPFVVDNTNPTAEERARYIAPARQAGFRVVGYYFDASLEDCLRRNATRTGREQIPIPGLRGTYKRLQLPDFAEGFDQLYRVRLEEGVGFQVEEWFAESETV